MPRTVAGAYDGRGRRIAVVVSRFNEYVTRQLLSGAVSTLTHHGVRPRDIRVIRVPGAFEIPAVAARLGRSGQVDAVICLGAVIRGETAHYEHVAGCAAQGVAQAALTSRCPVIFGVLTTETVEQAVERVSERSGHKGREAALCALEMIQVYRQLDRALDAT